MFQFCVWANVFVLLLLLTKTNALCFCWKKRCKGQLWKIVSPLIFIENLWSCAQSCLNFFKNMSEEKIAKIALILLVLEFQTPKKWFPTPFLTLTYMSHPSKNLKITCDMLDQESLLVFEPLFSTFKHKQMISWFDVRNNHALCHINRLNFVVQISPSQQKHSAMRWVGRAFATWVSSACSFDQIWSSCEGHWKVIVKFESCTAPHISFFPGECNTRNVHLRRAQSFSVPCSHAVALSNWLLWEREPEFYDQLLSNQQHRCLLMKILTSFKSKAVFDWSRIKKNCLNFDFSPEVDNLLPSSWCWHEITKVER